jgi:hypothetical protein
MMHDREQLNYIDLLRAIYYFTPSIFSILAILITTYKFNNMRFHSKTYKMHVP